MTMPIPLQRTICRVAIAAFSSVTLHASLASADSPPVPNEYTPGADEPAAPKQATPGHDEARPDVDPGPAVSRRTIAFVAAGVAVVGIGVGTAFGVLALNSKSDFNDHPTVARANTGNQEAVLSDVAFGAAVVAGVTSVVLFLEDAHHHAPEARPAAAPRPVTGVSFSVTPLISSHGGGAGAVLHF